MPHRQRDTVGTRIAQARRELGVRLGRDILPAQLAEMLGVNASTVARWEADEKAPSSGKLIQLAELLGVAPAWIMRGGDSKTAPQTGAPQVYVDEQDTVRPPVRPPRKRPASGG